VTVREEFEQILQVLLETPLPAGKRPPSTEKDGTLEALGDSVTSDKQHADCKGAAS
jgi:hypothetical protein